MVEIEEDPLICQSIQAIYLRHAPRWEGVDSVTKHFQIDSYLYVLFKKFLFNYFVHEEEGGVNGITS